MSFRVTKIKLDKEGNPSQLSFEMDADTAARAAYLFGQLSHAEAHRLGAAACYAATSEVFDVISRLFNGFYDEGINSVVEAD